MSKNGSNWVRLALNRVQIWIQSYNVLNKPDLNPTRPTFGSGWALRVQNQVELGRVGPQGQNSDRVGQVHLAAPVIQSSLQPKLYKCNSSRLHLPHQTDRQTDRQESRNPRCDEGFKVCSVSNRFSATLMDNPAGATARCRRQCGGVDGKFAFFPSSSKVAGTRKAGDLSE